MRILHTSDWHLGRQFYNVSLLEDQSHVIDQILEIAIDQSVNVIVIAGDLYDRSVPPAAATTLLDDVLTRIVRVLKVPVIITSGNHDGADRLGFGARVLEASGVHIRTHIDTRPVVLSDTHGPVRFHCLPFADPAMVSTVLGVPVGSHDEAMGALVGRIRHQDMGAGRDIVVAHCFVAGGQPRESERPLSVGGAECVSVSRFDDFDYTALGHLHSPQNFSKGRVRYSGSILKYSFSESEDHKSVSIVDLDEVGVVVDAIPLNPRRDMGVREGQLQNLLDAGAHDSGREDYLLVRLTDTHAILDVMAKLREVYPNVLHVERPALQQVGQRTHADPNRLRTGELPMFADFWQQMTGDPLSDEARALVAKALDAIRRPE